MDRLAVDELITDYARAVDDADWAAYEALFAGEGRADYRSAGGIEGGVGEVVGWLARSMPLFAMRQHLIVNRRVRFGQLEQDVGDTARVQADFVNPMRFANGDAPGTVPDFVAGGRYAFALVRTYEGWRFAEVVVEEKWRRLAEPPLS